MTDESSTIKTLSFFTVSLLKSLFASEVSRLVAAEICRVFVCDVSLVDRENRVHELGDFYDVGVEIHGEAREVHGGELGAMLLEIDPAGIGGEIDDAPFFVAVAEIADAAEKIGEMNDGR